MWLARLKKPLVFIPTLTAPTQCVYARGWERERHLKSRFNQYAIEKRFAYFKAFDRYFGTCRCHISHIGWLWACGGCNLMIDFNRFCSTNCLVFVWHSRIINFLFLLLLLFLSSLISISYKRFKCSRCCPKLWKSVEIEIKREIERQRERENEENLHKIKKKSIRIGNCSMNDETLPYLNGNKDDNWTVLMIDFGRVLRNPRTAKRRQWKSSNKRENRNKPVKVRKTIAKMIYGFWHSKHLHTLWLTI